MARPKPNILLEHIHCAEYKTEQILEATRTYAVYYNGEPINVRVINKFVNKYKKSAFSNSGHAVNLATRLNELFNTKKFEVFILKKGELFIKGSG